MTLDFYFKQHIIDALAKENEEEFLGALLIFRAYLRVLNHQARLLSFFNNFYMPIMTRIATVQNNIISFLNTLKDEDFTSESDQFLGL